MTELDRLAEIQKLAALPELQYDAVRKETAVWLGIRVPTLDKEVSKLRPRKVSNLFEHSNTHTDSLTERSTSGSSNGCSNEGGVRMLEELSETAKSLIEAPDVLARVQQAIESNGYAGDPKPVVLIYVALSSRLLDKPVNAQVVAPSSTGKNFAINAATQLVPDDAIVKLSAMSPKALIHGADDLRHKTVVLAESNSLALDGNAASLVHSIIEEARTDFDVVERDPETGRSTTRRISKEGPTGLITSGLRELQIENSTRVLAVHLSDSPQQTRAVVRAEAALARGKAQVLDPEEIGRFVDFQRWLAAQPERRIVIPFASVLAEEVPVGEVRMRRDFKQLLSIIKTIALLNQEHRGREASGAIIAELADYRWARELLLASFRSIVTGGLTDTIRQTCLAVPEEGEGFSEAELVKRLDLSKSTIHYRVGRALKGGWLTNLEHRRGYAYRLVRGAPLPEEQSPLPTVETLQELFEHRGDSIGYSNGPQTTEREGESTSAFECSNGSKGTDFVDEEGIDIYPDDHDEPEKREP